MTTSQIATPEQVAREIANSFGLAMFTDNPLAVRRELADRITTALEVAAKSAREDERKRIREAVEAVSTHAGELDAASSTLRKKHLQEYKMDVLTAIATEAEQENQNHGR